MEMTEGRVNELEASSMVNIQSKELREKIMKFAEFQGFVGQYQWGHIGVIGSPRM